MYAAMAYTMVILTVLLLKRIPFVRVTPAKLSRCENTVCAADMYLALIKPR